MSATHVSTFLKWLGVVTLAAFISSTFAQEGGGATKSESTVTKNMAPLRYTDTGAYFYDDKERGWHWYEDPLEDELAEKAAAAPPPPPPEKPKPPEVAKPSAPAGPPPLSAEWLKTAMPKYATTAIDKPTDENVRAYLYLQRYALDKANNYALASARVTSQDPYLDMNTRQPLSAIGTNEAYKEGEEIKQKLLFQLAKTTGILFFFRGDCRYCHIQWPLLMTFAKKYNFTVMPISVDGGIIDGMDPKLVVRDKGQSSLMNVTTFPSMYLLKPPNNFAVVSYGVTAVEGFGDLVIQAAVSTSIIDEKMLMATRGIKDRSIRATLTDDATEEVVNDPVKLVEYMKRKMKEK